MTDAWTDFAAGLADLIARRSGCRRTLKLTFVEGQQVPDDVEGKFPSFHSFLAKSFQPKHVEKMIEKETIAITDIRVPAKRVKTLDSAKVEAIAESIIEDGQTTPIQVRTDGQWYVLVEGLHRLEALRALGEASIVAYIVQARLH